MIELRRLLSEVLEDYADQERFLDEMALLVEGGHAEQIDGRLVELEEMKRRSQAGDLRIRNILKEDPGLIRTAQVQEYMVRLDRIRLKFDDLIVRMKSASSYISQEMQQLRGNRTAVGGYKSRTDLRGGRIKGAC